MPAIIILAIMVVLFGGCVGGCMGACNCVANPVRSNTSGDHALSRWDLENRQYGDIQRKIAYGGLELSDHEKSLVDLWPLRDTVTKEIVDAAEKEYQANKSAENTKKTSQLDWKRQQLSLWLEDKTLMQRDGVWDTRNEERK